MHTKSHKYPIDYWKTASYDELVNEIVDLRDIMEAAGIKPVVGYRQPFLQTAGDTLYTVLKDNNFRYDSSLPTNYNQIWWPYTLDHAIGQCAIEPCPKSKLLIFQRRVQLHGNPLKRSRPRDVTT